MPGSFSRNGQWKLLPTVPVAALAVLLALYLLRPQVEQPSQPAEEPRLIVTCIEAGEGGRVLVNGTEMRAEPGLQLV